MLYDVLLFWQQSDVSDDSEILVSLKTGFFQKRGRIGNENDSIFREAQACHVSFYQLAGEITRQIGSWHYSGGHETRAQESSYFAQEWEKHPQPLITWY